MRAAFTPIFWATALMSSSDHAAIWATLVMPFEWSSISIFGPMPFTALRSVPSGGGGATAARRNGSQGREGHRAEDRDAAPLERHHERRPDCRVVRRGHQRGGPEDRRESGAHSQGGLGRQRQAFGGKRLSRGCSASPATSISF